jgi:hypothetical protein
VFLCWFRMTESGGLDSRPVKGAPVKAVTAKGDRVRRSESSPDTNFNFKEK